MIEKLVSYLSRRRGLNVLLVIFYFIFILVMHDTVVRLSVWVMNSVTLHRYDLIIGAIMLIAMSFIIFLFIKNLRANKYAVNVKIFYMLIMMGLFVIHTQMNFVMNIEVIHMLQFGVVALIIFPLTRSFGATLYYTVMLGLVDELFQYSILYPDKNDYLDFNDVVLDQLGAVIMLVYLYSSGIVSHRKESTKWYKSSVLISICLIASAIAALFHFSLLSVYYSSGPVKPLLTLSESLGPEGFWRHVPNLNMVYHVMSPLEGVAAIMVLCGLFYLLDYLDNKRATDTQNPDLESSSVLRVAV